MRRTTGVLASAAMVTVMAGPAAAFDRTCQERGRSTQRIAVTFVRKASFLWFGKACRIDVRPGNKQVCSGDTVAWTVINTCAEEGETFTNIRMTELERVIEACEKPSIDRLGPGAAGEIVCTLKTGLAPGRQKYTVRSDQRVLDPELDIRR